MDILNSLSVVPTIAPAARANVVTNGASVDRAGFFGVMAVIQAGVITDGSHAFVLQDSADGSVFANVAAADQQGPSPTLTSANSNTVHRIGYLGTRRFLRVVSTGTGATTGGVFGASIVRGGPRHAPVA